MTRDVSDRLRPLGARRPGRAAFAADSPYGGDHARRPSGRIDPGRAELDQAVSASSRTTGGDDYDHALTIVCRQARTGTIALQPAALEGTGIAAVRAGRGGLRHTRPPAR